MKKLLTLILLVLPSIACAAGSLTPNAPHSISVAKMNSNGSLSDIQTVSTVTDGNGKLDFALDSVPTNAEANFIVITIRDAGGTVVRKGMLPAPPADATNQIGVNDLATTQADIILDAMAAASTDDPILAAYVLAIVRSPNISGGDVARLANLGKAAILDHGDAGSFEGFLRAKGVSPEQLAGLKACLINNPDSSRATLRAFSAGLYRSVNGVDANGNATAAHEELQRTGGLMADIFIDASACAGIELGLMRRAHEAAGTGAGASGALDAMGAGTVASIDQSMSAFGQKLGMTKVAADYRNALITLGATDEQISRFLSAVEAMAIANRNIDTYYAGFFADPIAYAATHGTTVDAVKESMHAAYSQNWSVFRTNIAASDNEILALRGAILAANPGMSLPPDFGSYRDQAGAKVNWPLPQVVMVTWIGSLTSFTYEPRDTTEIPDMAAQWMGSCSQQGYGDRNGCQQNGGTWTVGRRTFSTPSALFNAYLSLQQDVEIVEMAKNAIWANGAQPTDELRQAAEDAYLERIAALAGRISGTGRSGPLGETQTKAILRLMTQPNI